MSLCCVTWHVFQVKHTSFGEGRRVSVRGACFVIHLPSSPSPLLDRGQRAICLALLLIECGDGTMLHHLVCFSGHAYFRGGESGRLSVCGALWVIRFPSIHLAFVYEYGHCVLCLALLFMECVDGSVFYHLACFSGQAYVSW